MGYKGNMKTNSNSPSKDSPLYPYTRLLGARWSSLEIEEQAAYRTGARRGLLTLDADRRVVAKASALV